MYFQWDCYKFERVIYGFLVCWVGKYSSVKLLLIFGDVQCNKFRNIKELLKLILNKSESLIND